MTIMADRVRAAGINVAAVQIAEFRKKVADLLRVVQVQPDSATIERVTEQMVAMPKEAQGIAWAQSLSVIARSGSEAQKRILEENKRLKTAPNRIAVFAGYTLDQEARPVATVLNQDGFVEVGVSIDVNCESLVRGQHVALAAGNLTLLAGRDVSPPNPTCEFDRLLEDGRIMARRGEQILVLSIGGSLNATAARDLKCGDHIEFDPRLLCATKLSCRSVRVREFLGESSDCTREDVGGLDAVWARVDLNILGPLKYPELYKGYGVEVSRGVLLYGPPGVGKTLFIKALNSQILDSLGLAVDAPIIFRVAGSSLLRSFVGEGEALVRSITKAAEDAAEKHGFACVFVDELDVAGLHRGQCIQSTGAYLSLSSALLSAMDGISSSNRRVTWMATTNRVDLLDNSLLRPGRFGVQIEIRRPDFKACKEIAGVHLRNTPLLKGHTLESCSEAVAQHVFRAEDNALLRVEYADAEKTEIYPYDLITGAIISEAVRSAKVKAIEKDRNEGRSEPGGLGPDQLLRCLDEQLRSAVSAITPQNAHQHYLNLPPDKRIVAVDHLYDTAPDADEETFVC